MGEIKLDSVRSKERELDDYIGILNRKVETSKEEIKHHELYRDNE